MSKLESIGAEGFNYHNVKISIKFEVYFHPDILYDFSYLVLSPTEAESQKMKGLYIDWHGLGVAVNQCTAGAPEPIPGDNTDTWKCKLLLYKTLPRFCVDFSFCCIIKWLVDSLEQNNCSIKTSFHPTNSWTSSDLPDVLFQRIYQPLDIISNSQLRSVQSHHVTKFQTSEHSR